MRSEVSINEGTILLVDGDPDNVKLLAEILRVNGYRNVLSSTDPRELEGLCAEHEIDLIILDINLPYLDGFEVMGRLRSDSQSAEIPVIVITALADTSMRNRMLHDGARDYLTKPFNRSEVVSRIRNALEIHLLYKQVKRHNERLEDLVKERTDEIYATRLKIIRRLSRAAEFRDNETGMHINRMSAYSELLARGIGMSERDCAIMLNASPLHDVGKIGIPDRILLKQGKLSKDEWEIMKEHTLIGTKILDGDNCDLLSAAQTIALTHHERWDGSGYPHGLSGEDIPLIGRIVAVSDVFDALTSERPYKRAWAVDVAFEYMSKAKGKHFDAELVDCFLDLRAEVLEIRAEYTEESDAERHSHLERLE